MSPDRELPTGEAVERIEQAAAALIAELRTSGDRYRVAVLEGDVEGALAVHRRVQELPTAMEATGFALSRARIAHLEVRLTAARAVLANESDGPMADSAFRRVAELQQQLSRQRRELDERSVALARTIHPSSTGKR